MAGPASEYRYQFAALRGDYIRSAAGLALTGLPLAVAGGALTPSLILGGLALLFAAFGLRTFLRQWSSVSLSDDAIVLMRGGRMEPVRSIVWAELNTVKLAYYSTRRDKAHGWMNLKIRSNAASIAIDSMIDGFDDIAARVAKAVVENGLTLDDSTIRNYAALGIIIDSVEGRAVGARKDSIL